MGKAYDKACQSMHDWGQPEIIKEIIARRIIEVAQKGECDPEQLCELALRSLGFGEAQASTVAMQKMRIFAKTNVDIVIGLINDIGLIGVR